MAYLKDCTITDLKLVVWGAGELGNRFLEFWGKDNIVAFIDNDQEKKDTNIYGVPIIDYEEYKRNYNQYYIVITPKNSSHDIQAVLESEGVYRYFILDDCPTEMYRYGMDLEKAISETIGRQEGCVIYGLTLYSLIVSQLLVKHNYDFKGFIADGAMSKGQEKEYSGTFNVKIIDMKLSDVSDVVLVARKDECSYEMLVQSECNKVVDLKNIVVDAGMCYRSALEKYENIHSGKRCFIVGTGPSLTVEDLDVLKQHDEFSMSANRVYKLFDKTDWRPDYYMISDENMVKNCIDEIRYIDCGKKIIADFENKYADNSGEDDIDYYHIHIEGAYEPYSSFSLKPPKGIYLLGTVVYACIQMAVYMGFKEIYLIGVDCSYTGNVTDASNHFKGYYEDKLKIKPRGSNVEYAIREFEKSKEVAQKLGISIYNATRGGKLEVFERVNFDDLFGDK